MPSLSTVFLNAVAKNVSYRRTMIFCLPSVVSRPATFIRTES